MIRTLLTTALAAFIFGSCGNQAPTSATNEILAKDRVSAAQTAFLENLADLCGKSFLGKETFMQPGRESWANKSLIMHVEVCEPARVLIPFHIDDDHSRTWMFVIEESGLRFRHDHRHEDGTPEDQTLYGGYANEEGTAFAQYFPADDYTDQLLNDGRKRQWNVILADDLSTFTYQLHYEGKLVFEAQFNLKAAL